MADERHVMNHFTLEMLEVAMKIWMQSSISFIDIRSKKIDKNRPLKDYQLPTSMFIYTHGAPASVLLNQESYQTGPYGLCHAGKGSLLSITPIEAEVEAFMILYRAESPPFYRRHLRSLLETVNPFNQIYGFAPSNPLVLLEAIQSMRSSWDSKDITERFYAKVLLHQVIHQVFVDLRNGDVRYMEPDYVEWIKDYLDKHFREPVSIQLLAEKLPMDRSVLSRLFRKREKDSMQEYLIKKRIEAAKQYLLETNASLQEIAAGCGFTNEFNLIRIFKKYTHMSPSEYRHKRSTRYPNNVIDNDYLFPYNEMGLDNQDKLYRDGEFTMLGQTRSKQMIFAVAMSLMLLLSACGSGAAPSSSLIPETTYSQSEKTSTDGAKVTEAADQTRTIKTVKGDIKVPVNPQRVVVLFNIGDVLAFGVTPIAVDKFPGQVYYDEIKHIEDRPSWTEPEGMMAQEPDLIIIWGDHFYDSLKSVAPVIVMPDDLRERLTMLGEVFGMEERAEQLLKDYSEKIVAARARIQELGLADKTFTVIEENSGDGAALTMWYKSQAYNVIYSDLGLQAHPKFVQDFPDAEHPSLSMEVAGQYVGDYIFHSQNQQGDRFSESTVWQSLSAVQNGHVISLDADMFYWADIKSANAQLDAIMEGLESMVKQE